jgi:uncharacterized protein
MTRQRKPADMNANPVERFDPFTSRQCRQARNEMAQALLAAIASRDSGLLSAVARQYSDGRLAAPVKDYVNDRMKRYRVLLASTGCAARPPKDAWFTAAMLWNEGLFFECHEWIELQWHRSEDAAKKVAQSLIRAAGAYSHLEYGRVSAARKLAARAISGLTQYRDKVPAPFDADRLIEKLARLDDAPPHFRPPGDGSC